MIRDLFPHPVLDTYIDNWLQLKEEILKEINNDLANRSVIEPDISYTRNSTLLCSGILEKCPNTKAAIEKKLLEFQIEVGTKKLVITDSWINMYEYGQYLPPHNHLPHHITGTLFIDIPPDGGEFFFTNPSTDTDQLYLHNCYLEDSKYANPAWLIRPSEGQLLIFMSNMYHAAAPVKTKDFIRYTMAINARAE